MVRVRAAVPLSIVIVTTILSPVAAENWPQWRGPGGQGVSTEQQLPTEWQPERNITWKVPLPAGHSSPVVWGDRIFLTAALEGDVIPEAKAVEHIMDGKPWIHPDSVGADRTHTLSPHRQRHRDVPGSRDRTGAIRRGPRASAVPIHGVAGRLRRLYRAHQPGRRHVHAQSRSQTRDRAHELGRRAGVVFARHLQRADLHSGAEASVRDRGVILVAGSRARGLGGSRVRGFERYSGK